MKISVRHVVFFGLLIGALIFAAYWYFLINHDDIQQPSKTPDETRVEPNAKLTPIPTPETKIEINVPIADEFDYPIGETRRVTQSNDKDGWYNAQDFGKRNHLGEDWNSSAGGNTDCGAPVYAAAKGVIVFAERKVPGWGNVLIIRHRLADGELVETLYGHLQSFVKTSGEVKRREKVGAVGNGDGKYLCHLHFEIRASDCSAWGKPGPGYS
ncbi:MAG: M23 family metallopeptidase, partial [Pyrinomonadaceae bacterium]